MSDHQAEVLLGLLAAGLFCTVELLMQVFSEGTCQGWIWPPPVSTAYSSPFLKPDFCETKKQNLYNFKGLSKQYPQIKHLQLPV